MDMTHNYVSEEYAMENDLPHTGMSKDSLPFLNYIENGLVLSNYCSSHIDNLVYFA